MLTIRVLARPGHADQQAVAAGENGGEDLLDHLVLADDHLLQFFLHQLAMLAEFLENVAQTAGLGRRRGRGGGAWCGSCQRKSFIL